MIVPNSCQSKCPINSSNEFEDDKKMQNLLLETESDYDLWKQKMVSHAKKSAMLEVSLRKEKLKKELLNYVRALDEANIVEENIWGNISQRKVSTDDFVDIVAYSNICQVFEAQANFFGFKTDVETSSTTGAGVTMDDTPASKDLLTESSAETTTPNNVAVANNTTTTKVRSGSAKFRQDYLQTMQFNLSTTKS